MTTELEPQARELIGLALKGERRLPRDRERVRRGVLTALAAPAALGAAEAAAAVKTAAVAGGTAATGAKAVAVASVAWVKVAPIVAVTVAASVVGLKQLSAPASVSRTAAPLVSSHAVGQPERSAPRQGTLAIPPPPPLPPVPDASDTPLNESRASARRAEPPVASSAPPSLAAELEALQRAQRSLNAGNAAQALRELGAVRGRALSAERMAVEVFAHCALGNVAQARRLAVSFRRLAPESPLLARVNASCAGE